jgi:hypothetical protein
MKKWAVVSKELSQVVPILDDGSGPTEYWHNYIEVEAETREDALTLGIKLWRETEQHKMGMDFNGYEDENPFEGVTVEDITDGYPEEAINGKGGNS